jgi:hypothetical protein|nr:MAG TPA: hypothetical protein [Caudoviricetes sp.]
MREGTMGTIYVIRVYDEEWDEWVDIYAVGSKEEAAKEMTERSDRGQLTNFYEMAFKSE